jgi:peptidoglycan hydrolase-like protein with peptidoglycan-binding domain
MRVNRVLVRTVGIPSLCALGLIFLLSQATFAATTRSMGAEATTCHVLERGSKDAATGGQVSILQTKLKADGEGSLLGTTGSNHDGVDGDFGSHTFQSVEAYQQKHTGLKIDGIVGTHTWAALGGCDPVTSTGTSGTTSTTAPAPVAPHLEASGTGAKGSVDLTFTGNNQLTNVKMMAQDTACDAHSVYVQLRIYYTISNTTTNTYVDPDALRKSNSGGCQASALTWANLSYTHSQALHNTAAPTAINGVRLRVCVDNTFSDTCYESNYLDNPNVA